MASTINIQLKTNLTQAQARALAKLDSTKPREELQSLINLLKALKSRQHRATAYVATGSAAPVQATGTLIPASVIATDTFTVGKITFTATASPTTELHLNTVTASNAAIASATDVTLGTSTFAKTAHGIKTGDVVRVSTSSVLPAGLAASTDYYAIRVSADAFRVASTKADAVALLPLGITSIGTGTQTFAVQVDKTIASRIVDCINNHSTLGLMVSAAAVGTTVTVTSNDFGAIANHIALASTGGTITKSATFLASGAGGLMEAPVTYALGL